MAHELRIAVDENLLGSVDANQGDLLLGWDTDQFPTNIYENVSVMYEILRAGGFKSGGLNFDAKVRRGSFTPQDLFLAHIAGMDAYAVGLKVAARMFEDKVLENNLALRYQSYTSGIGKQIINNEVGLKELENYIKNKPEIDKNKSGQQELLEAIINQYLVG
jgi:xylose isomerase